MVNLGRISSRARLEAQGDRIGTSPDTWAQNLGPHDVHDKPKDRQSEFAASPPNQGAAALVPPQARPIHHHQRPPGDQTGTPRHPLRSAVTSWTTDVARGEPLKPPRPLAGILFPPAGHPPPTTHLAAPKQASINSTSGTRQLWEAPSCHHPLPLASRRLTGTPPAPQAARRAPLPIPTHPTHHGHRNIPGHWKMVLPRARDPIPAAEGPSTHPALAVGVPRHNSQRPFPRPRPLTDPPCSPGT